MNGIEINGPYYNPTDQSVAYGVGIPVQNNRPPMPPVPGPPGPPGESAYQIAVRHGFVGTETEWLESLKGEQGLHGHIGPRGPKGEPGHGIRIDKFVDSVRDLPFSAELGYTCMVAYQDLYVFVGYQKGDEDTPNWAWKNVGPIHGEPGQSAYEIAIAHGYVGTEDEWLESLKGAGITDITTNEDGSLTITYGNGEQVTTQPLIGPQGPEGPKGEQGERGEGITDIRVNEDKSLTILYGDGYAVTTPPVEGPQGEQGPEGPAGKQGVDGKSAFEIAVEQGYVGTEEEWINSLHGPQGEQGIQGPKGDPGDANIQIATRTTPGVVIPGESLSLDSNGVINIIADKLGVTTDKVTLARDLLVEFSLGDYNAGDTIPKGTPLTNIIAGLFKGVVPPNYVAPQANFDMPETYREARVGEQIVLHFRSQFIQNDAGNLTRVDYLIDGRVVASGSTSMDYNYLVTEGEHDVYAKIYYQEGPVKRNNRGELDPTGRIEAGSVVSEHIVIKGAHQVYAGGSESEPEDINYYYLESLQNKVLADKKGVDYVINIPTGVHYLCIAVPEELGELYYLRQASLMTDILDLFTVSRKQIVTPAGAEPYVIYTLQLASAFTNDDLIFRLR